MGAPVGAPRGATHNWRARLRRCSMRYRPQAELVPNYVRSVERWLASAGAPAPAYNATVNA